MKELEIIASLVEGFPKCATCGSTMSCKLTKPSADLRCNLREEEVALRAYGCAVNGVFHCDSCDVSTVFSTLYCDLAKCRFTIEVAYLRDPSDAAEVYKQFYSKLTIPCAECKGFLYPDNVFCCQLCKNLEEMLCARCAVEKHKGVGHFLSAISEENALKHQKKREKRRTIAIYRIDGDASGTSTPSKEIILLKPSNVRTTDHSEHKP
ncbi:hypothetical protein QR680_005012 [Steinernema hermaphroditum]|uniref:Uncharacterized protein n=1 Tax=Steinernema hermaphroditum TaxID=289476 RepID=A0AA39LUL6_9BILA|nr:hypothetical protein QR680_005012 [Steinernema hermaphroditum]